VEPRTHFQSHVQGSSPSAIAQPWLPNATPAVQAVLSHAASPVATAAVSDAAVMDAVAAYYSAQGNGTHAADQPSIAKLAEALSAQLQPQLQGRLPPQ
jgi:ABC-type uncharacterized transport system substrate-binding protein